MDQNGCSCQGSEGKVAGLRRVTRGPKRAPSAQPLYRVTFIVGDAISANAWDGIKFAYSHLVILP
jgi:hypothetical protein